MKDREIERYRNGEIERKRDRKIDILFKAEVGIRGVCQSRRLRDIDR